MQCSRLITWNPLTVTTVCLFVCFSQKKTSILAFTVGCQSLIFLRSAITTACLHKPLTSISLLFAPSKKIDAFLPSADFFQNQVFWKILSGISSECQTDWIQIRPDILSGLIWVQTVCKSYQQTTLVGKELNTAKHPFFEYHTVLVTILIFKRLQFIFALGKIFFRRSL